MNQQRFSTQEVTRLTGATARQLQWWDEISLVVPAREANRRAYFPEQILDVQLMLELRRSHLPLETAQRVLRSFHGKAMPHLAEVARSRQKHFLLVNESGQWIVHSAEALMEQVARVAQPIYVISLREVLGRLGGLFVQSPQKRPSQRVLSFAKEKEVRRAG
jgi:DNA-binding transcriptional MerR regulator